MATIRKRRWERGGQLREAWIADYSDQAGERHIKTFEKKKDAEAWLDGAKAEIRDGTHTADSASVTVGKAGDLWIREAEADGLERSTVAQYRQHLDLHIKPFLDHTKLSRLTAPAVVEFRRKLRAGKRSSAMVKKVLVSLGSIVAFALENGMVAKNVVRDARRTRRRKQEEREEGAVEIPEKAEVQAMLAKATGRLRAFLVTAVFCGLRSSELRGLTWDAVDLDKGTLTVRQRADAWNDIGAPKTRAGRREIPLAPVVVNSLKEWKLACPRRKLGKDDAGDLWFVFPNGAGRLESHSNIVNRDFGPLQVACGITRTIEPPASEKPFQRARYGLHALRHFAASLFIEQGIGPKRVQTMMGHSNIQVTFDVYGHLFPSPDDDKKAMAQIQARLLA